MSRAGRRWRLLDLFCGAGGCSAGYHAAGFDITGVDKHPQPDYLFEFIHADALDVLADAAYLAGFDVVHAPPPCQLWSTATPAHLRADHPNLIAPVREALAGLTDRWPHLVWVMENVPGAPLHSPVVVCGDTLRLGVRRHRLFEANVPLVGTGCVHDRGAPAIAVYGSYGQRTSATAEVTTVEVAREAMGIDWMPWPALTQAIPPAYTHWLGVQLVAHLRHRAADATPASRPGRDGSPAGQPSHPAPLLQVASVTALDDIDDGTHLNHGPGDATPPAYGLDGLSSPTNPQVKTRPAGLRHCRCGNRLPPRPATGRWPRYCSQACRQAAYRTRQKETA